MSVRDQLPSRSLLAIVLVAVSIVGGAIAIGYVTFTDTDSTEQADSQTPSVSPETLPPGYSLDGVDAEAAYAVHTTRLDSTPYDYFRQTLSPSGTLTRVRATVNNTGAVEGSGRLPTPEDGVTTVSVQSDDGVLYTVADPETGSVVREFGDSTLVTGDDIILNATAVDGLALQSVNRSATPTRYIYETPPNQSGAYARLVVTERGLVLRATEGIDEENQSRRSRFVLRPVETAPDAE
jgi:tetrahydromethanopterin S-methyltransferase subunit B